LLIFPAVILNRMLLIIIWYFFIIIFGLGLEVLASFNITGMNQRAVNVVHHCCWLAMLPLGYPLVAGCVVQTSDTADKMCLLSGEVRLNDCDGQR